MRNVVCLILVLSLCVGFNAHTQLYPEWTPETISNMQNNAHDYNDEIYKGRLLLGTGRALLYGGAIVLGTGLSLSLAYFLTLGTGDKKVNNGLGVAGLVTGVLGIAGVATGIPLYINGQKKYYKAMADQRREAYRDKTNKKE